MSGRDIDMPAVLQRGVVYAPGIGHGDGPLVRHPRVVVARDQKTRLPQTFLEESLGQSETLRIGRCDELGRASRRSQCDLRVGRCQAAEAVGHE